MKHRQGPSPAPALARYLPDAALILIVLACFWPLTRFFFAQDDFVFLEQASRGIRESLGQSFEARPGQFRPLTKGVYFLVTWPIFGFHPFPYHIVSLLLHALNAALIGVLLRRMGISRAVSWFAAAVFACNVVNLEAIAWVSCVQQLLGGAFMLAALIVGLAALSGEGRRQRLTAAGWYALALASYEQTLAVPMVLLAWQWYRHGWRAALAAARGPVLPMFLLLAAYSLFMFFVKGTVESGPYVMSIGTHVFDNLRTYTGLTFSIWLHHPPVGLPGGFTLSHAIWTALIGVHIWRGTLRDLLFGVATFLLLLAPVLFTRNHTHSFHLYVPAIGALFVLASVIESFRQTASAGWRSHLAPGLVVAAVVCVVGSVLAVRWNITEPMGDTIPLPRTFVLRRAVLAERMCQNVQRLWPAAAGKQQLVLVYPGRREAANARNIQSALASGRALRLFLREPDLEVTFVPPAKMPESGRIPGEVIVYTGYGKCYTPAEWERVRQRASPATEGVDK